MTINKDIAIDNLLAEVEAADLLSASAIQEHLADREQFAEFLRHLREMKQRQPHGLIPADSPSR